MLIDVLVSSSFALLILTSLMKRAGENPVYSLKVFLNDE